MIGKEIIDLFRVPVGKRVKLKKYDPAWRPGGKLKELCKEGLKDLAKDILNENLEEIREMAQDALEDGILMGCDEGQLREVLGALVDSLVNPYGAGTGAPAAKKSQTKDE